MTRTDRPCPTGKGRNRCSGTLTEAVAQAGEHEGEWVEACFVCGYEKRIEGQTEEGRP